MTLAIWWLVALLVGTVAHEFGHLLCARISSIPVAFLSIGTGPRLLGGKVGELRWEIRAWPLGGLVAPRAVIAGTPRWILFILGGVLGNAAVIGAVAALAEFGLLQKWPAFTEGGASPLVFAQVIFIVGNLIPFRTRLGGTRLPFRSDGLRVIDLVSARFKRKPETEPTYAALFQRYHTGGPLRPSAAAPQIIGQLQRAAADEKAWPEVKAFLLQALASAALPHAEELLVLDKLVTVGLISGEPMGLAKLDEWSLRASTGGPDIATIVGSRGAVLVELGRYKEGRILLRSAANSDQMTAFDMVLNDVFLARAEHALGNTRRAHYLIKTVRRTLQYQPTSPDVLELVARVEAKVEDA